MAKRTSDSRKPEPRGQQKRKKDMPREEERRRNVPTDVQRDREEDAPRTPPGGDDDEP
jgi:hypothetical protein